MKLDVDNCVSYNELYDLLKIGGTNMLNDLMIRDFPPIEDLFDHVTNNRLLSFVRIEDILDDGYDFGNIVMHKYLDYDDKNYNSDMDLVRDYVLGNSGCTMRVVYESKDDTCFYIKFIFDNLVTISECCNKKMYSNTEWDEFKDNLRVYFRYGVPVLGMDCSFKREFDEYISQECIILIHKDNCEMKSILFDDCDNYRDYEAIMVALDIFDLYNEHIFDTQINAKELLKEQIQQQVKLLEQRRMESSFNISSDDSPWDEDDFSDIIIKTEDVAASKSNADNYDEEEIEPDYSVVPDGITQIRLVSLKLDGEIVAYRFKTDKGSFDIRRTVMAKYGFGGTITDKFINLEYVNGVLMSSSEKKNNSKVPNVSDNEKDCKKLINLLFK